MSLLLAACVVVCQLVALSTKPRSLFAVLANCPPAGTSCCPDQCSLMGPCFFPDQGKNNTCVLFMFVCVCVFGGVGASASTVV